MVKKCTIPDKRVKCNDCFALGVLEKKDPEDRLFTYPEKKYYCRVSLNWVESPYHPHDCDAYRFYD